MDLERIIWSGDRFISVRTGSEVSPTPVGDIQIVRWWEKTGYVPSVEGYMMAEAVQVNKQKKLGANSYSARKLSGAMGEDYSVIQFYKI